MPSPTPGPWVAALPHGVHATDGRWVATVRFPEDAHLIAAAPELYEALEALVEACIDNHDGHEDEHCRVCTLSVLSQRAMRKAREEAVSVR